MSYDGGRIEYGSNVGLRQVNKFLFGESSDINYDTTFYPNSFKLVEVTSAFWKLRRQPQVANEYMLFIQNMQ